MTSLRHQVWDCWNCKYYYMNMDIDHNDLCYHSWDPIEEGFCDYYDKS